MTDALADFDTVVVPMLENRSLATVLGWLHGDRPPTHIWPPGSNTHYDGIPPDASNSYHSHEQRSLGTAAMRQPCRVPRWDPNEPFEHVTVQLFGTANGTVPTENFAVSDRVESNAPDRLGRRRRWIIPECARNRPVASPQRADRARSRS